MTTSWDVNWLTVFIVASFTAIATGIGVLPFRFTQGIRKNFLGYANAIAAGLMLAASFRLVNEGISHNLWKAILGFVAGLILIHLVNDHIANNHQFKIGKLKGANALKALMIIGVMTIHSFAEGIGVGVSFVGGRDFGIFIATAIAVHNIPEGLAIGIVLIPRGIKVWQASLWAVFTSIPQPLLAVPSYLFVESFQKYLPVGLGIAGGAMVWMVTSELLPDALKDGKKEKVALFMALAVGGMMLFQNIIAV